MTGDRAETDIRAEAKALATSPTFRKFRTPGEAAGMCEFASTEAQLHLGGEVLRLSGRKTAPVRHPDGADPAMLEHYVVRVGDLIVDLTARQFDPVGPFPLVMDARSYLLDWLHITVIEG